MRVILVLIAIVLLASFIGWISFNKGPDRSSINIETQQIRTDANRALRSGGEMLHKAGDELKEKAPVEPAPVSR